MPVISAVFMLILHVLKSDAMRVSLFAIKILLPEKGEGESRYYQSSSTILFFYAGEVWGNGKVCVSLLIFSSAFLLKNKAFVKIDISVGKSRMSLVDGLSMVSSTGSG
ncbi:MAG: hypothetical protein LUF92_05415 [Clostridiales bacterium]|nr:hypothetical protein [Clostridiales bacterium]